MVQRRPGDAEEEETHPAFAVVSVSRISGNCGKLFGSHMNNHMGSIRLTITPAKRYHSLSRDWIFPESRHGVVEIELSHVQFAEMITTMNVSEGTPCTLRYANGKQVPGIPDTMQTEQEKVSEGFKTRTTELADKMAESFTEVDAILNKKGAIGKADREVIRSAMRMAVQDVRSNMPFVLDQFVESTEKVAKAAKAEVEGFLTSAIHSAGLDAFKTKLMGMVGDSPALTSGDDPE